MDVATTIPWHTDAGAGVVHPTRSALTWNSYSDPAIYERIVASSHYLKLCAMTEDASRRIDETWRMLVLKATGARHVGGQFVAWPAEVTYAASCSLVPSHRPVMQVSAIWQAFDPLGLQDWQQLGRAAARRNLGVDYCQGG